MDPRDPLRALPDGMTCTVCNEPVPVERTRLLARREELTFVQVDCSACGSTSLEFLVSTDAVTMPGPASSRTSIRDRKLAPAVTTADVRAMRAFLDGWAGDARGLVDRLEGGRSSARAGWSGDGRRRA
ncbi:MAG: hypothetical protein ABI598_04605 [Chloroflexota bacterium]